MSQVTFGAATLWVDMIHTAEYANHTDDMPAHLKKLRTERGVTQRVCARIVHVTTRQYQRWESGDSKISFSNYEVLTTALSKLPIKER